jgi:hypothetical protein
MHSHFPKAVPEIPVSNVDELFHCWRKAGAKILAEPEDKPRHLREFRVADLDGNQLRVFYDISRELRREQA